MAIRERVDTFVADLTELIRASALEAVNEALAGTSSAPAPAKRARKKAGTARKAVSKVARKGKRVRRTAAQVDQAKDRVLRHVRAHPGQRLGEIAASLGMETKDARRPAFMLVESGDLKTTGQRGGTRYFPKGAAAAAAPKKKRAAKKRKTARKSK